LDQKTAAPLPEVLRFYVPLAATSVLMMVTHSVISGAVARTLNPALALAAYSAAYSVGQVFESPCYGMQRMGLTFIAGKRSSRTVTGAALGMLSVLLLGFSLTAWTPIAGWVFKGLLRVPEDAYPMALASLRVFIVWPVSSAVRSMFQPHIVLARRTVWLSVNMAFRVGVMVAAALALPRLWPGGPVGATILVLGIGTEALLAAVVSKSAIPPLADEPEDEPPLTPRQVLRFALPLALAASAQNLGRPVVTAALLRTVRPEITLSGYQVASSFSYIFVALTYNIYHAVVVYVRDRESYRKVQAFSLGLGALGLALLAACSIPQVGNLVFGRIIGAPADISREAMKTLAILTVSPLGAAAVEFYGGILMMKRHASWLTLAKIVNMASTCLIAIALAVLFPAIGSAAGAIAVVAGPLIETAISYRLIHVFPDCRDLAEGRPASVIS
jgi:hypothetical protein